MTDNNDKDLEQLWHGAEELRKSAFEMKIIEPPLSLKNRIISHSNENSKQKHFSYLSVAYRGAIATALCAVLLITISPFRALNKEDKPVNQQVAFSTDDLFDEVGDMLGDELIEDDLLFGEI